MKIHVMSKDKCLEVAKAIGKIPCGGDAESLTSYLPAHVFDSEHMVVRLQGYYIVHGLFAIPPYFVDVVSYSDESKQHL